LHSQHERDEKEEDGRDHVVDHARRNDRDPLRNRFRRVRPRVFGDFFVGHLARVGVVLSEHLHVPTEGNRRQRVFGLAPRNFPEHRAEADAEALDLDAAPLGDNEMSQLVNEDHEPQPQRDQQDAGDVGQREVECR
jgi:hypothetical protein